MQARNSEGSLLTYVALAETWHLGKACEFRVRTLFSYLLQVVKIQPRPRPRPCNWENQTEYKYQESHLKSGIVEGPGTDPVDLNIFREK